MKKLFVFFLIVFFLIGNTFVSASDLKINPREVLTTWTKIKEQCLGQQLVPDQTKVVHFHMGLFQNPKNVEPEVALLYWDNDSGEVFSISWLEGETVWHFIKMGGVWKQLRPNP